MRRVIYFFFVFLACTSWALSGSEKKISSLQELNHPDCVIATQSETLASKILKRELPEATCLELAGPQDCYTALTTGKALAVVYDRPALEYAALDREDFLVIPENLADGHISIAAAKNRKELIGKVNEFIRQSRKDGVLRQMYDRWVRSKHAVMPDIEEPKAPNGVLVIGIDATNPPLCFLENRRESGYDIEFSKRLALYLNKEIKFRHIPFDGLISAVHGNKIDLAIAQMDATPERSESVLFSEDYMKSSIGAMIRKKSFDGGEYMKLSELLNQNVGTLTGSAYTLLAKGYMPAYKTMEFTTLSSEVAALESGKIDAFFTDAPVGRFLLLLRPKLSVIPEKIPCGDYGFVFSKTNRELCESFSREIRKMRDEGTLDKLQKKWFSTDRKNQEMPESLSGKKVLTMGVFSETQPFAYVRDGKIVGYEPEIAILAANRLGYQLKLNMMDMSGIIESVKTGKCDFAAGCIIITEERMESVLFSEKTYDGGISLIVRKGTAKKGEFSLSDKLKKFGMSLKESFDKTFIREQRWKLIVQGLATTLIITVAAVIAGTILSFPVCFLCRSKRKILSWLGDRYVSLIMGTPILVILMILYYVIFAKVDISGIIVAIIAFSMDFSAYTSVTLRSGIEGIPRGQLEAAFALGHKPAAAFMRFILPQAIRTVLPVYRGEIISTLKSTSVVGYIAIMDLTKMGDIIRSRTYEAFFPLIVIALIYFLTAKCLTAILLIQEKRLDPAFRRDKIVQRRGVK